MLPAALAFVAGFSDTCGFIGLSGLFTAHATGNLVLLGAAFVRGEQGYTMKLLALPVFAGSILLARLLGAAVARGAWHPQRPLLVLEALLMASFALVGLRFGPFPDQDAALALLCGMLGVAGMGVQNAATRLALRQSPATTAMTGNLVALMCAIAELALPDRAAARETLRRMAPLVGGFLLGVGCGAVGYALLAFHALLLPAGLLAALCLLPPAEQPPGVATQVKA